MVTNTTIDGVPAYATSDLLMPHPTIPGLYKIHGRADDQIMLSTGEKVSFPYLFLAPRVSSGRTSPAPYTITLTPHLDESRPTRNYTFPRSPHPRSGHVWKGEDLERSDRRSET